MPPFYKVALYFFTKNSILLSMNIYYSICFDISLVLSLVYIFMWHKHFDTHFSLIFAFIPVANMGYLLFAESDNIGELIMSIKIFYIGGCFLVFFILMCVLDRCKIKINRFLRVALMLINSLLYASVLTIGKMPLFYKSITMEIGENGQIIANKEYGPMHTVFMIVIMAYFIGSLVILLYTSIRKKDVSILTIRLLAIPELICIIAYFFAKKVGGVVELVPAAYVLSQVVYLIIANRLVLYDINAVNADSIMEAGEKGFIAVDFNYHYLGCNDTAKKFLPHLENVKVDSSIKKSPLLQDNVYLWAHNFKHDENNDHFIYRKNGRIYNVEMVYLFDGKLKRGYSISIVDDTKNQNHIELINRFNAKLRDEVEEKTQHLIEMHDNLILSMAAMVESRDNSTGGHIKRTSEGVRILIDEILKGNELDLSEEFCRDIVKAAPMHDLGKIAVPDKILRKKGRFEPWEYEKMKKHAPAGAKIIHEILKDTDDEHFRNIAENVAKYHHERWDGSGYPDHLKGEEIPIEARIMAIADVYDALVSKRVYKDSMSFEEADKIIMLGMGNQFDESLKPYYLSAKPRLEEYYSSLENEPFIVNTDDDEDE